MFEAILILTILICLFLAFLLATDQIRLSSRTSRQEAKDAVVAFREDEADFIPASDFDEEGRSKKTLRMW